MQQLTLECSELSIYKSEYLYINSIFFYLDLFMQLSLYEFIGRLYKEEKMKIDTNQYTLF